MEFDDHYRYTQHNYDPVCYYINKALSNRIISTLLCLSYMTFYFFELEIFDALVQLNGINYITKLILVSASKYQHLFQYIFLIYH